MTYITATTLYNLVQCPKRVERDFFGPPADRDPVSPFVAMLWDRGTAYEKKVVANGGLQFLDLSFAEDDEKERLTLEAMRNGEPLIYNGRISSDGLIGVPDLLRRHGSGYLPIDIKSGRGEEAGGDDEEGKPKLHYAVQLALYINILEQLGFSAGRRGFVLDVRGKEVGYDFERPRGVRSKDTLWEEYQSYLVSAKAIAAGSLTPKGALASSCKLCHWYSSCSSQLRADDDLTLIPVLGRAIRDAMEGVISTVSDLAQIDPEDYIAKEKTEFKGVGADRLRTFHARAKLLTDPNSVPYLKTTIVFPVSTNGTDLML